MKTLTVLLLNVAMVATLNARHYRETNAADAQAIVSKVNARNEGKQLSQKVTITMTDRRGKVQERVLKFFRKDYTNERKSVIFYQSPANVKGTAFLTFDYAPDDQEDNQWLYLPALRKTRRISAANRGDYFLGTDLTYEDVKLGSKIGSGDYQFTALKNDTYEGKAVVVVDGTPLSDKIGKELGYSKVRYTIDTDRYIPLMIEFWDIAGNPLKVIRYGNIKLIQGIWTVHRMDAENFKTDHKTVITFEGHDYKTQLSEDLFTEEALLRGI